MTNLAGEYLGKEMTWEEMVKAFPSMWVYVTDYVMDGPDIMRGRVVGVVTDADDDDMFEYCWDNKIDYRRRRTKWEGGRYIDGENIEFIFE